MPSGLGHSSSAFSPGSPRSAADRSVGDDGRLKVWIDQDLCTGDAMCVEHVPQVFTILEDGIAYCRQGDKLFNDPGGPAELALVPLELEDGVVQAAAECPGECIFVEVGSVG